jgi:hypothetical protein
MAKMTSNLLPLPPRHDGGGWTGSAVVATVVGRLAHEFPDLPLGSIIAATVRSIHELRTIPLTTLRDAPFDGVAELVEGQTRHALRAGDAPVPAQPTRIRRAGEVEQE